MFIGRTVSFWNFIYSFIFVCTGSLVLCKLLSNCSDWGCSLVVVLGTLLVMASLVAEHGLQAAWASVGVVCGIMSFGSWALEHRLNSCGATIGCSEACGIFPDQGLDLCLLHWQADSLPLDHQGSPRRTDSEAEAPILWPPDAKCWLVGKDPVAGKDWGQEEKRVTEDEMVGWHHQLSGHEFEPTPGDSGRQGSLVCCSPWGHRVRTRLSNWKTK